MEIGKTLRPTNRKQWRNWLLKNHKREKEIWLVFYNKDSGKTHVPYIKALDEALCFGWIDSTVKKFDTDSRAQRFTPRRPNSPMSEMNKEKVRRLIKEGRMAAAGLTAAGDLSTTELKIPTIILKELKKDKEVWKNFQSFPQHYKRIRISWIAGAKSRRDTFKQRLNYFLKMTKKGKKYGMEQ